jgi:DNA replication protein DnaC
MYKLDELPGSIKSQIRRSNVPMKSIGLEFSDLDPSPTLDAVQLWVEQVKAGKIIQASGEPSCGLGLLLIGEPGHGKTTIASTTLQTLVRTVPRLMWGNPEGTVRRQTYFSDYPKLLRLQKYLWNAEDDDDSNLLMQGLHGDAGKENNVPVFVLDDIGKEYRTANGWAENTFDSILRSRFNAGLPTIVTTNVPLKDWGTVYGEPMGSFAHEAFIPLVVKSSRGDRRK